MKDIELPGPTFNLVLWTIRNFKPGLWQLTMLMSL